MKDNIQFNKNENKAIFQKKITIQDAISKIKFNDSLSEIKDNKDNNSGNILNVSYLSIIDKKEKDNNFSGTTKNDEYKSTDNVSTKSKKKKLIKVLNVNKIHAEIDKTSKDINLKNTKEISNENDNVKNSNYFSNEVINKDLDDIKLKDSLEYFESDIKCTKNYNESFLQSEHKLRNLFIKFEKSRTKSFIIQHMRKSSNFTVNLNFKKELLNEKGINDSEPNNFNNLDCKIEDEENNNIKDASENISNFELSKQIFENINKNKDISEIFLPARYISLPYMKINKNLKIKGSPGTLLEIKNGFILLEKSSSLAISECSLVFNYEQSNFIQKLNSENDKYSKILENSELINNKNYYNISCIKIMENSHLEINDCDFRSIIHENEEILEDENKTIKETLINCVSSDEQEINNKNNNSNLNLNSSIFSNFDKILESNFLKNMFIDNCHFSEVANTVFLVKNFLTFNLENSVITNTKTGIEIHECDLIKSHFKQRILVKIKNCQIFLNHQNAIVLINTNANSSNAKKHLSNKNNSTNDVVEIINNKITQNKGFGISIENFMHKSYEIVDNKIEENLLGNILINNITKFDHSSISSLSSNDTEALLSHRNNKSSEDVNTILNSNLPLSINYSEYDLIFLKNEIRNCYSSFGIKIVNSTNIKILFEHNIFEKNLIGMHFINNNSIQAFIKNSKISSNLESGVIIVNNKIKSRLIFFECNINFNKNFGINASNNHYHNSCNAANSFSSKSKDFNDVCNNQIGIFKGELNDNNIGFSFDSFLCKVDHTKFLHNKLYSINIKEEKFKDNLKFLNYEKNFNTLVNTPIGGNWGILNNDKCICQNGKCVIF